MRRVLGTLAAVALLGLPAMAQMTNVGGPLASQFAGKPVVAIVRADWCTNCKQVEPVLESVKKAYGDKVAFVALDVTNGKTAAAAADLAKTDGLTKFFEASKQATSTVAVIDSKTGDVIAEFYDQTDASAYRNAIEKALKSGK